VLHIWYRRIYFKIFVFGGLVWTLLWKFNVNRLRGSGYNRIRYFTRCSISVLLWTHDEYSSYFKNREFHIQLKNSSHKCQSTKQNNIKLVHMGQSLPAPNNDSQDNHCRQGMFIFLFRCVLSRQVRSSVVSSVKKDGLMMLIRGLAVSSSRRLHQPKILHSKVSLNIS